jgi:hypothetical protein
MLSFYHFATQQIQLNYAIKFVNFTPNAFQERHSRNRSLWDRGLFYQQRKKLLRNENLHYNPLSPPRELPFMPLGG